MIAPWAANFIGIPYADGGRSRRGADCWGLVLLVYQEGFGIELPLLAGLDSTAERDLMERTINGQKTDWRPVDQLKYGDVLLYWVRHKEWVSHVAVYVGDGTMLMGRKGSGACLAKLENPFWERRFVGAYRHRQLR